MSARRQRAADGSICRSGGDSGCTSRLGWLHPKDMSTHGGTDALQQLGMLPDARTCRRVSLEPAHDLPAHIPALELGIACQGLQVSRYSRTAAFLTGGGSQPVATGHNVATIPDQVTITAPSRVDARHHMDAACEWSER